MKELLRLEHIYYSYEDKYPALKDVSVSICEGERIAVLGNNGAGKSTFFLNCNGVLRPLKGKIFLKGQQITNSKKDISLLRQSVGLVFQDPDSQIIAGTVENEVSFGPMNLKLEIDQVKQRVKSSLEQMNLDGYQNRAPQYLSGGEKKRVSIADILAMKPEVLLLDEPTASLDPENSILLEQTLNDLSRNGCTLVVSTHDVDFAFSFATRAIVFSNGEIIADGDIQQIFASETILRRSGLKKPLLYATAELIEKHFKIDAPSGGATKKPCSLTEFQHFLDSILTTQSNGKPTTLL